VIPLLDEVFGEGIQVNAEFIVRYCQTIINIMGKNAYKQKEHRLSHKLIQL